MTAIVNVEFGSRTLTDHSPNIYSGFQVVDGF